MTRKVAGSWSPILIWGMISFFSFWFYLHPDSSDGAIKQSLRAAFAAVCAFVALAGIYTKLRQ